MTTGVVTGVTTDWRGDTLVGTVSSGSLVLPVSSVVDFDEAGGWLVVGDSAPLEYVTVDEDALTVTLAAVTPTSFEDGLPVDVWDPTAGSAGKRVVEYIATVELSDDTGSPDAVIPHATIPTSGVENLIGASVQIAQREDGEWYVSDVLGRAATLAAEVETLTLRYPSGVRAGLVGNLAPLGEGFEDLSGLVLEREDGLAFVNVYDVSNSGTPLVFFQNIGWFKVDADVPGGIGFSLSVGTAGISGNRSADRLELNGEVLATQELTVNNKITYLGPPTSSAAANLRYDLDNGVLKVITSSERYKTDIREASLDPDAVRRLVVKTWTDKAEVAENPETTRRHIGVTAEDLDALGLTEFVEYDGEGRPDGVQYDRLFAVALTLAQDQESRIARLEAQVAALLERG